VRSIIAMAQALGLRVVTEGIETEAQAELLRSLGCDEVQGYLFGKPDSAEAAFAQVAQELARARPARDEEAVLLAS